MKKFWIIIIALCLYAFVMTRAYAQNWPFLKNAQPYATLTTLVTATTTTGVTGAVVPLGIPFKSITCMVTNPSGSVPTGVNTRIDGSIDGTNFVSQMTNSTSTFPTLYSTSSATAIPLLYIQGNYISKVTGTNSAIQVDCIASH